MFPGLGAPLPCSEVEEWHLDLRYKKSFHCCGFKSPRVKCFGETTSLSMK